MTSLRRHVAGLGLVLLAIASWVGVDGYFFIDEAAIHAQLEVRDDGAWVVERPFPEIDSELAGFPMARAVIAGDTYAPFAKHPAHVEILHRADDVGGRVGVRAVSLLGALGAAVAAARLARPFGDRVAVVALWTCGLTSPLIFQADLVVGHAVGAALAGGLSWCLLVAPPRTARSRALAMAAAVLAGLGVLVRSEFVLVVAALAAVVVGGAVLARRRAPGAPPPGPPSSWPRAQPGTSRSGWSAWPAAAAVVGASVAFVAEPALTRHLVGSSGGVVGQVRVRGGGVGDVLAGTARALFDPGIARPGAVSPLSLVLAVALGYAAVALLRRGRSDERAAVVCAAASVAAAVVHLTVPDIVPGIVWAFPGLAGLVALRRRELDVHAWSLVAAAALYALAVAATQYENAGGIEWGWRYVTLGLPLVCPLVALGAVGVWDRAAGRGAARAAVVLVAATSLLVPASGVAEQRRYLADTARFLARADAATVGVDAVVSVDPSFGRLAYEVTLDRPVVTVGRPDLDRLLVALAGEGVAEVALVWRTGDRPEIGASGGYAIQGRPGSIAAGYRTVRLVATTP